MANSTRNKATWLAECQEYLLDNQHSGICSWQDHLIEWLEISKQVELAKKVKSVQFDFMHDTDLGWAYDQRMQGLRFIKDILSTAKESVNRIFLSHSSADKGRVQDYCKTLKEFGYKPWLDEDAMAAGTRLERGLLDGMKSSMAAVFFITQAFNDKGYLSAEIDYAVTEKIRRGDDFAIITLVFSRNHGHEIEVPQLLQRYVWKTPKNDLEGLREIIRALPPDA